MSTTSNTTRSGGQWTDELSRREKATLRANWGELCEYLPAPGIAWEWGEAGLSERLKHYLRHHSLIVRDPDDECWQTSEGLWMWMIEQAGDDETIGKQAEGQCKLPISTPARAAARSGVLHTTPGGRRDATRTRQTTLEGDTIDPSEAVNDEESIDTTLVEQNLSKGTTTDDGARDAGQRALTRWTGIDDDAGKWDVTVGGNGLRVRRAGEA